MDTRSESVLSTHNTSLVCSGKFHSKKVPTVDDIDYQNFDVIILDEGQFLKDVVEFCITCRNNNIVIIVGALLKNFRGEYFESINRLKNVADVTYERRGFCKDCLQEHSFTNLVTIQRTATESYWLSENDDTPGIGGADKYVSLCKKHFEERCLDRNERNRLRESETIPIRTTDYPEPNTNCSSGECLPGVQSHQISSVETTFLDKIGPDVQTNDVQIDDVQINDS